MTNKTTMPEPVAEIQAIAGIEIFDLTDYGKECGLTVGQRFITTAQAEAYKDACVRDSLEEAAMILKANAEACHSDTRIMLRANAEAILSLIKRIA